MHKTQKPRTRVVTIHGRGPPPAGLLMRPQRLQNPPNRPLCSAAHLCLGGVLPRVPAGGGGRPGESGGGGTDADGCSSVSSTTERSAHRRANWTVPAAQPAPVSAGGGLQADPASAAAPGLASCSRLSVNLYPLLSRQCVTFLSPPLVPTDIDPSGAGTHALCIPHWLSLCLRPSGGVLCRVSWEGD